jgi:hypothetical protein
VDIPLSGADHPTAELRVIVPVCMKIDQFELEEHSDEDADADSDEDCC